MKQTCQQVFQDAVAERRQYPLHEGLYKLREGRHSLQATADEIKSIAAFKRKEVDKHQLQQCQVWEIAQWLRSMPTYIAHVLGRTVLPAFGALAADDIPAHDVARLQRTALQRISTVIAKLDRAQRAMAGPIGEEYARMKAGNSAPLMAIEDAIDLIDMALTQAKHLPTRRDSCGIAVNSPRLPAHALQAGSA